MINALLVFIMIIILPVGLSLFDYGKLTELKKKSQNVEFQIASTLKESRKTGITL